MPPTAANAAANAAREFERLKFERKTALLRPFADASGRVYSNAVSAVYRGVVGAGGRVTYTARPPPGDGNGDFRAARPTNVKDRPWIVKAGWFTSRYQYRDVARKTPRQRADILRSVIASLALFKDDAEAIYDAGGHRVTWKRDDHPVVWAAKRVAWHLNNCASLNHQRSAREGERGTPFESARRMRADCAWIRGAYYGLGARALDSILQREVQPGGEPYDPAHNAPGLPRNTPAASPAASSGRRAASGGPARTASTVTANGNALAQLVRNFPDIFDAPARSASSTRPARSSSRLVRNVGGLAPGEVNQLLRNTPPRRSRSSTPNAAAGRRSPNAAGPSRPPPPRPRRASSQDSSGSQRGGIRAGVSRGAAGGEVNTRGGTVGTLRNVPRELDEINLNAILRNLDRAGE